MEQLIQQVAAGLANGAIYACLALALVMIFVSTDHINFAQGEMAMFSAYICWQLLQWGMNFWIALPLTMALSRSCSASASSASILRPLHNAPVLSVVVVFIGLLTIFHALAGGIWTHTIKAVPSPVPAGSRSPARATSAPHQLGMIVVTLVHAAGAVRVLPLHAARASPCAPRRRTPTRRASPASASTGCWRWAGALPRRSARWPA